MDEKVRWLTAAEAEAMDELIEAVRDSERRPAGEGQVHLSPRVSRALARIDDLSNENVSERCPGSGAFVWREDVRYYFCEICDQKFADHELKCDTRSWVLPDHFYRKKK